MNETIGVLLHTYDTAAATNQQEEASSPGGSSEGVNTPSSR
jgi:hypothetical protein